MTIRSGNQLVSIIVPSMKSLLMQQTPLINDPKCACEAEFSPVCGSDGNTYTNACLLRCVEEYLAVKPTHTTEIMRMGTCAKNICNCNPYVNYVCGSDQYTYINSCYLRCQNKRIEQMQLSIIVEIASTDQCKNINFCINNLVPVCGSDSKSYRNLCFLQYASDQNLRNSLPLIYLKSWGPCHVEICPCPLHTNPVCGSNGREYSNICLFNCEKRRRIQLNMFPLSLKNAGPCDTECSCSDNLSRDPVCGNDGKTYLGRCNVLCANKKRQMQSLPPIHVIGDESCDCTCPEENEPVCASDIKTYRNLCELECENHIRKLKNLTALMHLSNGPCEACTCSHYYVDPVCSSDGRNFNNPCFLICENRRRELQGLSKLTYKSGPCTHSWNYIYDPVCLNNEEFSNPCQLHTEPASPSSTDDYFTIHS